MEQVGSARGVRQLAGLQGVHAATRPWLVIVLCSKLWSMKSDEHHIVVCRCKVEESGPV